MTTKTPSKTAIPDDCGGTRPGMSQGGNGVSVCVGITYTRRFGELAHLLAMPWDAAPSLDS